LTFRNEREYAERRQQLEARFQPTIEATLASEKTMVATQHKSFIEVNLRSFPQVVEGAYDYLCLMLGRTRVMETLALMDYFSYCILQLCYRMQVNARQFPGGDQRTNLPHNVERIMRHVTENFAPVSGYIQALGPINRASGKLVPILPQNRDPAAAIGVALASMMPSTLAEVIQIVMMDPSNVDRVLETISFMPHSIVRDAAGIDRRIIEVDPFAFEDRILPGAAQLFQLARRRPDSQSYIQEIEYDGSGSASLYVCRTPARLNDATVPSWSIMEIPVGAYHYGAVMGFGEILEPSVFARHSFRCHEEDGVMLDLTPIGVFMTQILRGRPPRPP
jgi:hypothetical protein